MNEADYKRLIVCDFAPDKRYQALYERLEQYYLDTPNSMDNRDARKYWIAFNRWCSDRDYTRQEINHAKRNHHASS